MKNVIKILRNGKYDLNIKNVTKVSSYKKCDL